MSKSQLLKQLIITCTILLISLVVFELFRLDIWLQNFLYHFDSQQWIWNRNEPISKFILYDGIKKLYILFVICLLLGLIFFRQKEFIQKHKPALLIILLSTLLVPLVIGILKATTNIPCPKDLQYYNGSYPEVTLSTPYPSDFKQSGRIKCYPAGHASGGFALLSLIFLFKQRRKQIKTAVVVTLFGWTIGLYKTVIGDHFFSHTLVTMLISWLLIICIALVVQSKQKESL